MKYLRNTERILLIFLCIFFLCVDICHAQLPPKSTSSLSLKSTSISLSQGLQFIENKGQLADQFGKSMPEILYSCNTRGMECYLTAKGIHFVFSKVMPR